jgi:hypothetical protein
MKFYPPKVTASLTHDYSAIPACTATRSTNCSDHFEVEHITRKPRLLQSVANSASPSEVVNAIATPPRLSSGRPRPCARSAQLPLANMTSANELRRARLWLELRRQSTRVNRRSDFKAVGKIAERL